MNATSFFFFILGRVVVACKFNPITKSCSGISRSITNSPLTLKALNRKFDKRAKSEVFPAPVGPMIKLIPYKSQDMHD